MKKERSCGAVVYKREYDRTLFLLERMVQGHVSLPKGHVEAGETEEETARREIREETGLETALDTSFRHVITYSPAPGVSKDVVFFLAEALPGKEINQECEVAGLEWLPLDAALAALTFDSDRETLALGAEHLARESYADENARVIDRWVEEGWEWGRPIDHETYAAAQEGRWDVLLTPVKPVPHRWFGQLRGKKVLGLASGGGQQMPIFAALGAECTVLDYSPRQLESERAAAAREGYEIEIIRADMSKPLPFADESFDLIFHPVSNCYIREVRPLWRECCRVLKKGGVLLAGLDNGINFLFDDDEETVVNTLPFDPLADPEQMEQLRRSDCGVQFSHTLEEQLGGQLEAGLVLTDLYEDTNGEGRLHERNIPSFVATRSVRPL